MYTTSLKPSFHTKDLDTKQIAEEIKKNISFYKETGYSIFLKYIETHVFVIMVRLSKSN